MGCAENMMTQKEHDELHVGQCPDCDSDVDAQGDCVEMDDCSYSPLECEACGYRPCSDYC